MMNNHYMVAAGAVTHSPPLVDTSIDVSDKNVCG